MVGEEKAGFSHGMAGERWLVRERPVFSHGMAGEKTVRDFEAAIFQDTLTTSNLRITRSIADSMEG
jgi:hypothetical protein